MTGRPQECVTAWCSFRVSVGLWTCDCWGPTDVFRKHRNRKCAPVWGSDTRLRTTWENVTSVCSGLRRSRMWQVQLNIKTISITGPDSAVCVCRQLGKYACAENIKSIPQCLSGAESNRLENSTNVVIPSWNYKRKDFREGSGWWSFC